MGRIRTERDPSELTQLLIVFRHDGDPHMQLGTVADLASILEARAYQDTEIEIVSVQVLGRIGLRSVSHEIIGGNRFDEDDYAHVEVIVHLGDGVTESAFYTIDGRA